MSRLIVKNLPNGMKEERFRNLFAAFGTLTDCSLKFTKDGKFRKFGFIGFKSEEDANAALAHFNKSFIDTARVTVEFCKSFGDPQKPRAWSKHSLKPPVVKEALEKFTKSSSHKEATQDKKKKKNRPGELKELEEEESFRDFLAVHQKRSQAATWSNDAKVEEPKKSRAKQTDDYLNFDSDESESLSEGEAEGGEEGREERVSRGKKKTSEGKMAARRQLSDMDYLRSKVVKGNESSPSSGEESGAEDSDSEDLDGGEEEEADDEKPSQKQAANSGLATGSGLDAKTKGQERVTEEKKLKAESQAKTPASANEPTTPYTVKLRGAPFNVTEQNVKEFLVPLRPVAIRIARNAHGNKTGYVFVDFNSEEEVQKALKRNHEYMGGRYIEVFPEEGTGKAKLPSKGAAQVWQRTKKDDEEEEDLSESGRLFVRNLPYTSTEEDLEAIFSKYGPLSEIHFPIDSLTKKPKGFAFITYMFPEHAVKAFAEVDGQVFQGRMLHVLPSTIKKQEGEGSDTAKASSYKKQKESKDKANSSSSHNWNTLFMGVNAVADAVAQKYNSTKSQVFDHESKGSVAVRVALGETELVQNVRQFLLDNGVSLDSFSQAAGERSKTVILVKNLPAGTEAPKLEKAFGAHGSLGRVLLPEGGVTAIVEFLEPTEAKRAFTKLAYSKFQNTPLYLEWAPMGVFSGPAKREPEITGGEKEGDGQPGTGSCGSQEAQTEPVEAKMEDEEDDDEDEESIPGCTLFIKNLNFVTTEEILKEVFSKVGAVKSCTVSKKKDKAGALLSMGFGFVEYKKPEHAQKALKQLQGCSVDGHQLEVKISERAVKSAVVSARKKQTGKKQRSSKILVRNIPFQATVKEIRELFSTFGELKTVRLPKKMVGTGTHRGFGFVDFLTKQDAKRAFNALCHSTHLYGRRLVLEWADSEETVEALRRKTAEHFHDSPATKKKKRSAVLEEILEKLEDEGDEESS